MTAPLELDGVTKRYGAKPAVRDLSVQIGSGERVAILGRNGAGKTTLLRLALGLSRPSRGSCRLFGQPPQDRAALRRIGYSPQLNSAPGRLRVREVIRFVCDCKDAAEPAALLDRLRLEPLLTEQAGGLSLGQLRRLTVLLAFIGEPDLVVLDEPTVSLDAESRSAVWELIDEFCDAGGTLLLASHDFREVAALTQRVLVLANGQLRADNQVSELARSAGVTALEVPRRTDLSLAEASFVTHTADRTVLVTRQPELVLQRIGGLADQGRVVQRRPTVEEVCLALAGGTR